jgi:hypothetical protein
MKDLRLGGWLMPSYENPAQDADEAAEALRGLAHASRVITDPSDTYRVLGSLSMALASLGQSLDQLAYWHDRNADRAITDDGDQRAGRYEATTARTHLYDAADRVHKAHRALNEAFNHNGRIAWQPGIDADLTRRGAERDRSRRLAPPSAFGTDTASQKGPGPLGR